MKIKDFRDSFSLQIETGRKHFFVAGSMLANSKLNDYRNCSYLFWISTTISVSARKTRHENFNTFRFDTVSISQHYSTIWYQDNGRLLIGVYISTYFCQTNWKCRITRSIHYSDLIIFLVCFSVNLFQQWSFNKFNDKEFQKDILLQWSL